MKNLIRSLTFGLGAALCSVALAQPYQVTVQGHIFPCSPAIAGGEVIIMNIQEGINDTVTLNANCYYSATYSVYNITGEMVVSGSCGDGTSDLNSSQYAFNTMGETIVTVDLSCGPLPTDCEACFTMTSSAPFTADFNSACSDGETPFISYEWDFSDGGAVSGETVQHTYSAPGWYTVCLNIVAGNGCWDNMCESVVVDNDGNVYLMNSGCEANFGVEQATDGNGDPIPFELDITNLSTGDAPISYAWQLPMGETSSDFEPGYTLPNTGQPGVYGLCLNITTANCTSWHCDSLYVLADGTLSDPFYFDCLGVVNGPDFVGAPCDDGDPDTENDQWNNNCDCEGTLMIPDCEGTLGGPAQPGTPCDDNDPETTNDQWTADCDCEGTPPEGPYWITVNGHISPCTPAISNGLVTIMSVQNTSPPLTQTANIDANCYYTVTFLMNDPTGWFQVTAGCGDGTSDSNTGQYSINLFGGDTITLDLDCSSNEPVDCEGTPNGPAQPGTPCDDGDPMTFNDTWTTDCECEGNDPLECEAGFWVIQAYDSLSGQIEPIPYQLWAWNLSSGNGDMQYLWDFGDGETSTDPFPSHVYPGSGPYWLCLTITDAAGCTDTYCDTIAVDEDGMFGMTGGGNDRNVLMLNVQSSTPTSISEAPTMEGIQVWPNPANDLVNIKLDERIAGRTSVRIIDANGRLIRSMERTFGRNVNTITLPVADLDAGMYLIRIENGGTSSSHRFVREQ